MWITQPNFLELISQIWSQLCNRTSLNRMTFPLKRLKAALKNQNASIFCNIFQKLSEVGYNIQLAKLDLQSSNSEANLSHLQKLESEYDQNLLQEEIFYKQKSRISWLKEDDRNFKVLHHILLHKRRKPKVVYLILHNGTFSTNHGDIISVAICFFKVHITSETVSCYTENLHVIPLFVNDDDNVYMLWPSTSEGVQAAVDSILADSAPRLDEFSSSFSLIVKKLLEIIYGMLYWRSFEGSPFPISF